MFDTPIHSSEPNAEASVSESSPERDDQASTSTDTTGIVADYLSTLSGPSKSLFDDIWDDSIDDSLAKTTSFGVKYQTLPTKKTNSISEASTTSSKRGRKLPQHRPATSTVRLSSFGAEKVCPLATPEQMDDFSQSEIYANLPIRQYTSEPYSWMNNSPEEPQPEPRPGSVTSDEAVDSSLEAATSRPSHPMRHSQFIRQSRGNPLYAKKVNIPVVPSLPKLADVAENNRLNKLTPKRPVSPHRINNFVYESSPNRLILDFGESPDIWSHKDGSTFEEVVTPVTPVAASTPTTSAPSTTSSRPPSGLMAIVKETRSSLHKTISGTMTLARRKKHRSGGSALSLPRTSLSPPPRSGDTSSKDDLSNEKSLKEILSSQSLSNSVASSRVASASMSSLIDRHNASPTHCTNSHKKTPPTKGIRKPSCPPPLPPPRPSCPPPPPPPPSVISAQPVNPVYDSNDTHAQDLRGPEHFLANSNTTSTLSGNFPKTEEAYSGLPALSSSKVSKLDDVESSLKDFKIDLKTETDIPKTGFDFLDNW